MRLRAGAVEQWNAIGSSASSRRVAAAPRHRHPPGDLAAARRRRRAVLPAGEPLPGPGDAIGPRSAIWPTPTCCFRRSAQTLERAAIGYVLALVLGTVVGLAVVRVPVLRAGCRIAARRAAEPSVGRLGADSRSSSSHWRAGRVRGVLRGDHGRFPVHRDGVDVRVRQHPAAHLQPGAFDGRVAARSTTGTSSSRRRCRATWRE